MLDQEEIQDILATGYLTTQSVSTIKVYDQADYDNMYSNDLLSRLFDRIHWAHCKAGKCLTSNPELSSSSLGPDEHSDLMRSPFGCGFATVRSRTDGLVLIHGFDLFRRVKQYQPITEEETFENVRVYHPYSSRWMAINVCCFSAKKALSFMELMQLSIAYNLQLLKCYEKHSLVLVPFIIRACLPVGGSHLAGEIDDGEISEIAKKFFVVLVETTTQRKCDPDLISFGVKLNASFPVASLVTRLALEPRYACYFQKLFRAKFMSQELQRRSTEFQLVHIGLLARLFTAHVHTRRGRHAHMKIHGALVGISEKIVSFLERSTLRDNEGDVLLLRQAFKLSYRRDRTVTFILDEIVEKVYKHATAAENILKKKGNASLDQGFLQEKALSVVAKSQESILGYLASAECPISVEQPED